MWGLVGPGDDDDRDDNRDNGVDGDDDDDCDRDDGVNSDGSNGNNGGNDDCDKDVQNVFIELQIKALTMAFTTDIWCFTFWQKGLLKKSFPNFTTPIRLSSW